MRWMLITAIGWLVFNLALAAALLMRRDRPELRAKLAAWVVGASTASAVQRNKQTTEPATQSASGAGVPLNGDRSG